MIFNITAGLGKVSRLFRSARHTNGIFISLIGPPVASAPDASFCHVGIPRWGCMKPDISSFTRAG